MVYGVHVYVLFKVNPRRKNSIASVKYKYTVPKDDYSYEAMLYEYKYEGWSECSVTCGTGKVF